MDTVVTSPIPKNVWRAVKLLWTSAGLVGVFTITMWLGLVTLPGSRSMAGDTVTYLFTLGLLALIAVKLLKRRNWARWVLAVVSGLGVVSAIFSVLVVPDLWRSASPVL